VDFLHIFVCETFDGMTWQNFPLIWIMEMIQKYYSQGIVSECCLGHFMHFWCGFPEFETKLTQVRCSCRSTIRELWSTLKHA
jgi:hypothetical protein